MPDADGPVGERPAAGALRPVTPMGIAAADLEEVLAGVGDTGLPADLMVRLKRAHRLVGGLDRYLEACTTPESPALRRLASQTALEDWKVRSAEAPVFLETEMLSGHVEGQLLKMLVHATGARRVLEIGMFTGYSALAMAEALPANGHLVACELDPGVAALARRFFGESPAGSRIEVRVGPAATSLEDLAAENATFDLIFIDADKPGYLSYFTAALDHDLLARRGLICVDNTLLQGQPWMDPQPGTSGAAIRGFNQAVAADPRVEQVLVPLRDGVTLIRRCRDA
jgi:caffeoyl-CoA O-methyltransferase